MSLIRVILMWSVLSAGSTVAAAERPNVILILADDLGYGDIGCFGARDIKTPRIDQLAAEGLRLTSFYAQPICGPSRAALMTGTYPVRIAEPGNRKDGHTQLHTRETTLAERMRDAGYHTGLVGKWHLGMSAGSRPEEQGFSQAYYTPAFNGATRNIKAGARVPVFREDRSVAREIRSQADMDSLTGDCTREALSFLNRFHDQPFFLYLAYHMPHVPLGASAAFRGSSARGLYGDTVQELDHAVGQILDELARLSISDDTLVIFTSDNGPWIDSQIGDHGGSAGPFRGGKMMTWEGGWRVPCVVRWPARIPAGKSSDSITCTLDILPTVLSACHVPAPELDCDGIDLLAFLTTPTLPGPRTEFAYHNGARLTAVRQGNWKLVLPRPEGGEMPWAPRFVTSHLEAIHFEQLFDLANDPAEATDVSAKHPEVVQDLTRLARRLSQDLGDFTGPGHRARFYDAQPRWPK